MVYRYGIVSYDLVPVIMISSEKIFPQMNFKMTLRAGVKIALCMSCQTENEDFNEEARRKPFILLIHHYDRLDLLILVAVKASREPCGNLEKEAMWGRDESQEWGYEIMLCYELTNNDTCDLFLTFLMFSGF